MRSPIIWRENIGVNNSIHQKMPHSYIEKLSRSKCPTTTKCINNLRNLYSKQKVGIVHIQLNICVPILSPTHSESMRQKASSWYRSRSISTINSCCNNNKHSTNCTSRTTYSHWRTGESERQVLDFFSTSSTPCPSLVKARLGEGGELMLHYKHVRTYQNTHYKHYYFC